MEIRSMIAEIDAEIRKLQEARSILKSGGNATRPKSRAAQTKKRATRKSTPPKGQRLSRRPTRRQAAAKADKATATPGKDTTRKVAKTSTKRAANRAFAKAASQRTKTARGKRAAEEKPKKSASENAAPAARKSATVATEAAPF